MSHSNDQDVYQISSDQVHAPPNASGAASSGSETRSRGPSPSGFPPIGSPPGNTVYYPIFPRRRSFLGSLVLTLATICAIGFLSVMFFGVLFSGMIAAIQTTSLQLEEAHLPEKFVSGNRSAANKIVVLGISGTILGKEDGYIKKQIDAIEADSNVKAVVLRINSPGGSVWGSDYYLEHLKAMKEARQIPIVVSMGNLATSGGYYVSMVGDELYAEPTTWTGSIGVIAPMYDLSELCEKIGVTSDPITSGPHKAMGNITKSMSDEERKIWQALVDESFDRFKSIIREGRSHFDEHPEELDALATGQVYTAKQALALKLIDKIGFVEDAIERAQDLAGLTENNSKVVKFSQIRGFVDTLLEGGAGEQTVGSQMLDALNTPGAYYIMPGTIPGNEEE